MEFLTPANPKLNNAQPSSDLGAEAIASDLLTSGLAALKQQQYAEAIGILEAFCHDCAAKSQLNSRDYLRAQMHLVATYEQQSQPDRARALCHNLTHSGNAPVQIWATQKLKTIDPVQAAALPLHQAWLGRLRQLFQAA